MNEEKMLSMGWKPISNAPKDGKPFLALVWPLPEKRYEKAYKILLFKGKTFRYNSNPFRIFEDQKRVKFWRPLFPIPDFEKEIETVFKIPEEENDPKI